MESWQGTDSGDEASTAWHGPICRRRALNGGFKLAFAGSQRSSQRVCGGSHGDGWPGPPHSPKTGRVCKGAAWWAPLVPAGHSRGSSPRASLAIGAGGLLPEEMVAFLAFLLLSRAGREPLGDMLLDCLSFRPSTANALFGLNPNPSAARGFKARAGARGRAGQPAAGHYASVPCRGQRCLFHGWSNRCQRHGAVQHVGRGAEANPASRGGSLRWHSWLRKPPTSSKQILLAYSQPRKCTGHFMPLAPKPFPWDRNGEGECLLCSRFFFVPESFSSCTESLPLF